MATFSHSRHSLLNYFCILFDLCIILRIFSLHLFYYIFYNNLRFCTIFHDHLCTLHIFMILLFFTMLILSIVNLINYKKIWCFVHKYDTFNKSKQITFLLFFTVVFFFYKLVSTQQKTNVSVLSLKHEKL